MTTAAAARSNEQQFSNAGHGTSPAPARDRSVTPRPSISPLSNVLETGIPSPTMSRALSSAVHGPTEENGANEQSLDLGDDKSSSLSEPDDDDDEEMGFNIRERHIAAVRRDQDVDSEAETERLDQTPHKKQKQGEVNITRTPSKLAAVEPVEDELSDPPSPLPNERGAASSTSTVTLGGKKRKRSDVAESPLTSDESDAGESPRKRSHDLEEEDMAEINGAKETIEVTDGSLEPANAPARTSRGRKGKQKKGGRKLKDTNEVAETVEQDGLSPDHNTNDISDVKAEEDSLQKSEALDMFSALTKQFTAFRDALYNERLASIDAELALLDRPQCLHPEYLLMVACVEERRAKQEREAKAFYHYRQGAIRERTLSERSQIQSQYFQTIRELREKALEKLGENWYAIQHERRQGGVSKDDVNGEHLYKYVNKQSDLLRQQAKYNREVSVLSGLAKWVGFPAAPEMNGVQGDSLEEDLRSMKLARRAQQNPTPSQHAPHQHRSHSQNAHTHAHSHAHSPYAPRPTAVNAASAERLAHEAYIEQHAWARAPQSMSANHHAVPVGTPNISHTPDWAEPTGGLRKTNTGLIRNASGISPARQVSPFATPISGKPKKRPRDAGIDTQEAPENAEQGAARVDEPGGSSPLQVPKNAHRTNGRSEKDGWRNISGTSTIDAPLADNNNIRETYDVQQTASLPNAMSASEQSLETSPLHRHPAITPMFAGGNAELHKTAGFRPLEGAFGTPTPGPGN